MITLKRSCPVCRATVGRRIGSLEFALFDDNPLDRKFDVVCCVDCGFVFYDMRATEDEFESYYRRNAYYCTSLTTGTGGTAPHEMQRYQHILDLFRQKRLDMNSRIFDIGAGKGGLLQLFQLEGYQNLFAVDLVGECVRSLAEHEGIQAQIGSIRNIPFTAISADVIILSHLLEHVGDLEQAMQNIRKKLEKHGFVYVEVPDASKYSCDETALNDFYLEHINHFDLQHLCNLFSSYGFRLIESGHKRIGQNKQAPCLYGIFQQEQTTRQIEPDFSLARQIKQCFSHAQLDPYGCLAELANSQKPLYIWGLSQHTQMMLAMSPLKQCNIMYLLDRDPSKQGKTIGGMRINSPEILQQARRDDVVVLAAGSYAEDMSEWLCRHIGFLGKVINIPDDFAVSGVV